MLLAMSIVVSFVLLAAVTVAGQAVIERTLRPAGRLVEAGGGVLHIAEMGVPSRANEAPLVLLHGASGNLEDMRLALGETLARRWRVLLLDRPGHGLSSRSGGVDDASPARQAGRAPPHVQDPGDPSRSRRRQTSTDPRASGTVAASV